MKRPYDIYRDPPSTFPAEDYDLRLTYNSQIKQTSYIRAPKQFKPNPQPSNATTTAQTPPIAREEEPSSIEVPDQSPNPSSETRDTAKGCESQTYGFEPQDSKRDQSASAYMAMFEHHLPEIQQTMLAHEYCAYAGKPCPNCHERTALYICSECFYPRSLCEECITIHHGRTPFHHIKKWTGSHFARISLEDVKMTIHLGHGGDPCPFKKPRKMVIGHTNGFHTLTITFCGCYPFIQDLQQLLAAKLFPPTPGRPESAFTFALLDEMHLLSLSAKISTYDNHDVLQRLTNGSHPKESSDRYHEIYRVLRLWRLLASQRRSGQSHNIDSILTHRRPGSLTVRCPACPEVGFNIDKETIDGSIEAERHKYTLFLSIDGNYRLQLLKKRFSDPNDVPLNKGNAYFVSDEPYNFYLQHAGTSSTQSTCAHLRAVRQQNISKFKNTVYSGVVSVQCACHCMYLPQGTVNLEKGESYARLDYALVYALVEAIYLRYIVLSSDIWCQFIIHLLERIKKYFPQMASIFKDIRGAVPKMHVKGHKQECQLRHSFNYLPNSGETCGEGIETTWAEQNQAAASTKYQNPGHRQDSLDDVFTFWNWRKEQDIADYLARKYLTCKKELKEHRKAFDALTKDQKAAVIAEWEAMDTTPKLVNGVWTSVYIAQYPGGGPPTCLKAYEQLLEQEKAARDSQYTQDGLEDGDSEPDEFDSTASDTNFVYQGLLLQDEQYRVQQLVKTHEATDDVLVSARSKLFWDIIKWLTDFEKRFPDLQKAIPKAPKTSFSEEIEIYLPSHWDDSTRPEELCPLVDVESMLRKGQCYDSLKDLRLAIQAYNINLRDKQTDLSGQRTSTRAQTFLDTLSANKNAAANRYRRYRAALLRLGFSEVDRSLQPLHNSDLWGKNMGAPAKLGDTRSHEPWYWTEGRPEGLEPKEQAQWEYEDVRARWFRARAALDRCVEEMEILKEEIKRVHLSFQRMSFVWLELSRGDTITPGQQCYACKQSAMYERFAEDASDIMKTTFVQDGARPYLFLNVGVKLTLVQKQLQ